jgi:hypothetical protein
MRKLYASEIEVLSRLIFPEPYDVLLEETGLPPGALRDDLITLINFQLIEVWQSGSVEINRATSYDSDHIEGYTFRATATGLKHIRK